MLTLRYARNNIVRARCALLFLLHFVGHQSMLLRSLLAVGFTKPYGVASSLFGVHTSVCTGRREGEVLLLTAGWLHSCNLRLSHASTLLHHEIGTT
jgi:hypothetical protein